MIAELVNNLAANVQAWDYFQFCSRLQLDRGSEHSKEMWDAFVKVNSALSRFDKDRLATIFTKDGCMPAK